MKVIHYVAFGIMVWAWLTVNHSGFAQNHFSLQFCGSFKLQVITTKVCTKSAKAFASTHRLSPPLFLEVSLSTMGSFLVSIIVASLLKLYFPFMILINAISEASWKKQHPGKAFMILINAISAIVVMILHWLLARQIFSSFFFGLAHYTGDSERVISH